MSVSYTHLDVYKRQDYNNLFDDENGRRLKKIYKDYGIAFKISKSASIKKVYEELNSTLELMRKIRKRECEAPELSLIHICIRWTRSQTCSSEA